MSEKFSVMIKMF